MKFININLSQNILISLALFVALFAHISYLGGDFIGIDHGDIEGGRALIQPKDFLAAFTSRFGETGFYRPLVIIIDSIDAFLFGDWSMGYHITSIMIHLVFVLSVWFFSKTFFSLSDLESFFVMLIAGSHPLSWPIVGAVHYRSEQLAALFTLLTVSCYIFSQITLKKKYIFFTLFFFAAALFSKETTSIWISALIIYWEFVFGSKENKKSKLVIFLLGVVISVFYLLLRMYAVPEFWRVSPPHLTLFENIGTRFSALGWQGLYLLSPLLPSLSDATPIVGLFSPFALLALLVGVLAFVVLIFSRLTSLQSRLVIFFAVSLAPTLNIIPAPRFISPHYGYIATAGVGVLFLIFWRIVFKNSNKGSFMIKACMFFWIIIASISTFNGGFRFKNDRTYFEPEVNRDANFSEGHYFLGNYYYNKGDYDLAIKEFEAALQVSSSTLIVYVDRPGILVNLAGVRLNQNRLDEAERILIEAQKKAPENQQIIYNRALIALRKNDYISASSILGEYTGKWKNSLPVLLLVESLIQQKKEKEAALVLVEYFQILTAKDQEIALRFIEKYYSGKK